MKTKDSKPGLDPLSDEEDQFILIYDDDQEILTLCKAILAKSKYRVETLLRCENVINDIADIKPDIILMDLWIPEIGGEEAIHLIKANAGTQHIPVIIFSANAGIKAICASTKADDYIKKPFDISSFKNTIDQAFLKIKSASLVS